MNVAAVIFDLDGTILDSEPWHKQAEIEAFATLGRVVTPVELLPHVGTTLPYMLEAMGAGVSVEEFLAIERPILTRYIRERMEVFEDAVRLIDRLGVPCAIATSSMRWYLDETSGRFSFLSSEFAVRVCQADVKRGKPDPEIFLLACERLGVRPGDALVIEDSANGVHAALAAGCQVVGIARHDAIDLGAAHHVVASLDEVAR